MSSYTRVILSYTHVSDLLKLGRIIVCPIRGPKIESGKLFLEGMGAGCVVWVLFDGC